MAVLLRYRREKMRRDKQVGITRQLQNCADCKKSLSANAIFEDGVNSSFYQFANTVSLAFAIMDACMGAGLS